MRVRLAATPKKYDDADGASWGGFSEIEHGPSGARHGNRSAASVVEADISASFGAFDRASAIGLASAHAGNPPLPVFRQFVFTQMGCILQVAEGPGALPAEEEKR